MFGSEWVGVSQGGAAALGGYCGWGEASQDVGADARASSLDYRAVRGGVRHEVYRSRGEGARLDCSRSIVEVSCLLDWVGQAHPGIPVCEESLWLWVVCATQSLAALVVGVPRCVPWVSGCQWVEVEVTVGAKHLSTYLAEVWGERVSLRVGSA